MERHLYDVHDDMQTFREELTSLENATYNLSSIFTLYPLYREAPSSPQAFQVIREHCDYLDTAEDRGLLCFQIRMLFAAFDECLEDVPFTVRTISLMHDEDTLVVEFK